MCLCYEDINISELPWSACHGTFTFRGAETLMRPPAAEDTARALLRAACRLLAAEAGSRPELCCWAHSTLFSSEPSRGSRRQLTWLRKNIQRRCWFALCLQSCVPVRSCPPSRPQRRTSVLSARLGPRPHPRAGERGTGFPRPACAVSRGPGSPSSMWEGSPGQLVQSHA